MDTNKVLEINEKAWENYYSGRCQNREFPDMSYAKRIKSTNLYQVSTKGKKFSVDGQIIYLVRDENQLKRLFAEFEPVSVG